MEIKIDGENDHPLILSDKELNNDAFVSFRLGTFDDVFFLKNMKKVVRSQRDACDKQISALKMAMQARERIEEQEAKLKRGELNQNV